MSCINEIPRVDGGLSSQACVPSIHLLEPQHAQRWDEFVITACPEATFFHRAGWQTVIERAMGHKTWYFYAEAEGVIQGVLPLVEINSVLFGHSLSSLPFCVYGGIAAISESAREVLDRAAQALALRLKVDYLEYRNLKVLHSQWPAKDLYVTFRKEMAPDADENMQAIPRKQRAMVRKGIKAGLDSAVDDDVERFFPPMQRVYTGWAHQFFLKSIFSCLNRRLGSVVNS